MASCKPPWDCQSLPGPSSGGPAGSSLRDRDRDQPDAERLIDVERPDTLPRAPFRETVEQISAEIGAAVDWSACTFGRTEPEYAAPPPRPPAFPRQMDREASLSP